MKGVRLLIFFLFISLFLVSLVAAVPENSLGGDISILVGTSEAGVKYDRDLIGQFLVSEWVYVTVDIKDTTNITISNRNSPDFESTIEKRTKMLSLISESVLSTLSKDEFQLDGKLISGRGFYGNITKEGFDKLLQDERVKHIYSEKEIHNLSGVVIAKSFFIYILSIILLVILIIILIKLKKRKHGKKK